MKTRISLLDTIHYSIKPIMSDSKIHGIILTFKKYTNIFLSKSIM